MKKSHTSFLIKILSLTAIFAMFPFINTQAGDVIEPTTSSANDFDSI